jgi:hypothetical protein
MLSSSIKYFLFIATIEDSKDAVVANLNLRDSAGNTPLSLALACGMQAIVPDLIQGKYPLVFGSLMQSGLT